MNELFKEHEVAKDSPRVVWMKRYVVRFNEDDTYRDSGSKIVCYSLSNPTWEYGQGIDEDAAMVDFAKRNNLKLWSEEGL